MLDVSGARMGTERMYFHRFSQVFADFRFSWELPHFGGADFRRKPQDFRRFSQKPVCPI